MLLFKKLRVVSQYVYVKRLRNISLSLYLSLQPSFLFLFYKSKTIKGKVNMIPKDIDLEIIFKIFYEKIKK